MTEYFEVIKRDGPGRLGRLRLEPPQQTPGIADEVVVNAGSEWARERDLPDPRPDALTILPHRGLPPGTPQPVREAFTIDPVEFDGPSGAVVDPETAGNLGTDLYALSSVQGIMGHASAFRDAIIQMRTAIPNDTVLYLSGVATPANVPLLAYAGVDLVDTYRARIAATQGRYLTPDGDRHIDEVVELSCPCKACAGDRSAFDRDDLESHNVAILRAELARVRERIRSGTLREYVSARVRHSPWLTAGLRALDEEDTYLSTHEPLYRQDTIYTTTDDDLHHPAIRRFRDRVIDRYRNRFDAPLVILPCSAKKPYSESQSHRQFREAIQYRGHMVSLSSPIGVVPMELECTYPAQHYDVPVTGRWSASERSVIAEMLAQFLDRNAADRRVIAHVPPGPYTDIVERAATRVGIEPKFTVDDHPTTEASLTALSGALNGESSYGRDERRTHTIRAIADYQFGDGAGDLIFSDVQIESPYPKHRVLDPDGTHLATMVPQYGVLALTIPGAKVWKQSDVPTRSVSIDPFVPHGDVLAPGIVDADADIRTGEEVLVEGERAFAIGRAEMPGVAMRESTRGIAVDVRHTEERE